MSRLLMNERVVAVQPSLIRAFGSAAIVLQQVHYHAVGDPDLDYDGHVWFRLDLEQYGAETGLSDTQVRRAIRKLEQMEALISCAPFGYNRTKYHRINYQHPALSVPDCPSDDSVPSKRPKRVVEEAKADPPLTKNLDISSEQLAIDECEQCDKNGWVIPDVDDRNPPARKCDHRLGALAGGAPIGGQGG